MRHRASQRREMDEGVVQALLGAVPDTRNVYEQNLRFSVVIDIAAAAGEVGDIDLTVSPL